MTQSDPRAARVRAVLAGHRGDEAEARSLLTDVDVGTRCAALGALDRIGSLTTSDLQSALEDMDGSVRRRALEIAAKRSDVEIAACLDDSVPAVAETAAFAIGERTETTAVSSLIAMANDHEDALCRESAVAALGALATADEVDRAEILTCLLGVMSDRPQIRRRAVLGLFQFDELEAEEALQGALADKDRQVRAIAGDLLGVMTD
ncbi:MAG: HEAT repeat domain-containing protein [Candidatus Poriferisodalaceae bacterium]